MLVLDASAEVGEGPLWEAESERLSWVNVTAGTVHHFDPSSGHDDAVALDRHVGALAPRVGGGYVLAVRDGFALLGKESGAQLESLAAVLASDPTVRMNDGKCDAAGRFWAGSMAYELTPGRGRLFCLDRAGVVTTQLTDVTLSNGLGWSPDNRRLYSIDSLTLGVDSFEFDVDEGRLGRRTRCVDIPQADGPPDGMTVDVGGALWVALSGGGRVRRYTPDGRNDTEVVLPTTQVTSCTFGGPDMGDLYITTAAHGLQPTELNQQPYGGGILSIRPGTSGRVPHRYEG